jgi:hypothetical protein
MRLDVVYGFDDAPTANRFMNDVNSYDALDHARAKLFDGDKVHIHYRSQHTQYDNTLSVLDDLATRYGGYEVQN